jgi:hypothetical protein
MRSLCQSSISSVQPVNAVVHASVPVRVSKAREGLAGEALILDIAENAGELARKVNLFLHCPYYTGAE